MKIFRKQKLDARITEFAVVTLISIMTLLPVVASAQGAAIALVAEQNRVALSPLPAFSDVDGHHPYSDSIARVRALGVVKGNPDGTFAPDKTINRAELATMVVASLTVSAKGSNCFTDVHSEWFAPYVCEAKKRGLVSGYPDGSYQPFNNVNFSEAALIIAKAEGLNPQGAINGQPWYQPALAKLDLVKAIPTTVDRYDTLISRGQTAEILFRVLNPNSNKPSKSYASLVSALPSLNSCDELNDKLSIIRYKEYRENRYYPTLFMQKNVGAIAEDSAAENVPAPSAVPQADRSDAQTTAGNEASTDFSTTNTQVAGVDESDVIKNDGEFIYMVSGKTVRIVKAYQPQNLAQVSKLELSDPNFTPSEIYIYGTKLVVLGSHYSARDPYSNESVDVPSAKMMIYPPMYNPARAKMFVVDMSNKSALKEERSIEFDGDTVSTRRVDGYLYLVINKMPDYHTMFYRADGADVDWNKFSESKDAESILPMYKDSRLGKDMPLVGCSSVRFIPDYNQINFMTVAAVNLNNPTSPIRKEVVMGGGENIYSSADNLYVASTVYNYPRAEIYDTFAPVNYTETTRVTQFKLANGGVAVGTTGTVPGHILNQFAMDETASALRIATTVSEQWSPRGETSRKSQNNVYVLDRSDLSKQLGSLTNLASGETIYSVRFAGNRAYLVTFKKIDPFFVIDLSNNASPKVLGELKIPGYSNYLHPLDDNHVLGIGKDAVDPTAKEKSQISWWGGSNFAWYQGLKVAVFDVTDVKNPKLQSSLVIGDRGSDSELLYNHKALFFDKARGLIAFPVSINEVKDKSADNPSAYGTQIFQGAEVIKLGANNQLSELGRITHLPANAWANEGANAWESSHLFINRVLSIGNYLYTVGQGRIRASDINNLSEVKSLDVQFDKEKGWWGILY